MRAKQVIPTVDSTFEDFYDAAPAELQEYVDRCEQTNQSKAWHPEGNVKTHIKIVFNRAKRTGDINLMLGAFFHDLGKADVTKGHADNPDKWSAHGHEVVSAKLVKKYRDWIELLGGDFNVVYFVVDQHMRAHLVDEMRPSKRNAFKAERYFPDVAQFSEFDDMTKDYSQDID